MHKIYRDGGEYKTVTGNNRDVAATPSAFPTSARPDIRYAQGFEPLSDVMERLMQKLQEGR